ncbi:MAG: hypothetical protein MI976_10510, partial [Pseudomonadales bacterium]|nr:hypothetical protein [Pseudomonadales bacterium]
MAQNLNHLPIRVPKVERTRHILIDASPKRISDEIYDLPYADIACALTLARQKLKTINRFYLPGAKREAACESFNYAFNKFIEFYRSFHNTARFSRQPSDEDLMEMSQFTQELAYSYKLAFLEYYEKGKKHGDIARTLYTSMYYLGQSMLQSYEQNLWQSPKLWQEIHCLYNIAEETGYLGQEIPSVAPTPRPLTIEGLYTQILLTALADPYQLQSGSHWLIYDYAGRWAHEAYLFKCSDLQQLDYGFALRLDSSKPPLSIRRLPEKGHPKLRFLVTETLINKINDQLTGLRSGQPIRITGLKEQVLNRNLWVATLQHLRKHWGQKPQRAVRRELTNVQPENCTVVWGLTDIHKMLDPQARQQAKVLNRPLTLKNRVTATKVNESMDGAGFTFEEKDLEQLQIGQLIAWIRQLNGRTKFEFGTIQWIATSLQNTLQCGGKKSSYKPKAVRVFSDSDQNNDRPGLLINTEDDEHQLITPNLFLKMGDQASIHTLITDQWHDLEVQGLIRSTDAISHLDVYLKHKSP